jgi:hypothetical protein
MSSTEGDTESGHGRIVREAKEQAFHARRALRSELPDPSLDTKRTVAVETASYADAIEAYADAAQKSPEENWRDELPVDPERLVGESVTVEQTRTAGRTQRRDSQRVPAVAQVNAETLVDLGQELDRVANQLGFGARTKDSVPKTEITNGLIKEVEQWRRAQTQAQ